MASDFSELARSSAKGSLVLMLGQVTSTIMSAIGVIIVANFLGSFSLGEVTKVMIPVNIAILLNDFGVNSALTKYIAQFRFEGEQGRLRRLLEAGFAFNIVTSFLSAILLYFFAGIIAERFLLRPDLDSLVKVAALYVVGNSLSTMAQSVFVGFDSMGLRNVITVSLALMRSLFPPLLVWIGLGPMGAIIGNVVAVTLAGAIGVYLVFLIGSLSVDDIDFSFSDALRLLLTYGFPLYLGAIVVGGLTQLNNSLMTLHVEESLIGNYNAATNFSAIITLFTIPLMTVLFPLFSKINSQRENLKPVFQRAVKYTSILTLPVVLWLILLADPIVKVLYTDDFPYTAFYLQLYLIVFIFQGLGSLAVSSLVNGIGETRISFRMNIISLLLGVPLSLYLIPRYGIVGMLASMIIAPRAGLIYGLWWIKVNLGISFDAASSFSIYLSGGIAFIVCYLLNMVISLPSWGEIILFGVGFFVLYGVLLLLTNGLTKREIEELKEISSVTGPLATIIRALLDMLSGLTRR